jgi:formylglycine-generating enzyme required for sulfatase activity
MNLASLVRSPVVVAAALVASLVAALPGGSAEARGGKCPAGMASVRGKYCIDKYEAATVEIVGKGKVRDHSPFEPVEGLEVKAVSRRTDSKGRPQLPQAYISRDEAEVACKNAGKHLCTDDEWIGACEGKKPTRYPYGEEHRSGFCNDEGTSSFNHYYGSDGAPPASDAYSWANMNDPRLNQLPGTLAPVARFKRCRSGFDVYDMVGNLHEWTSDPTGTFRGGYYLDTKINGEGCRYRTMAHGPKYHDYSTGFRCCK